MLSPISVTFRRSWHPLHVAAHTPASGHLEKTEEDFQHVLEELLAWVLSLPGKASWGISDNVYKLSQLLVGYHLSERGR